jgi:hypothetical protein
MRGRPTVQPNGCDALVSNPGATGIIKSVRMLFAVLACIALAGCHRDMQNEDAVKRGVMDHLSAVQGLNIASMNVTIASMVFRQNEVDATVAIAPKGGDAAQAMTLHYILERKGDRWVVKPRADGGQSPHGGMGENPHGGGMGVPEGGSPAGALPPGHPAVPPPSTPQ